MKFKLELDEQRINLILKGLGNLQAFESMGLIIEIQDTCTKQAKEKNDESKN